MLHTRVRVKEIARQKGVGFNELQKKCELSPDTMNTYWQGKRPGFTLTILDRIAQELGVKTIDLLETVEDYVKEA